MERGGDIERGGDVGAALRELAPQVLGALVHHHGHFDACEDAVQDALLDATVAWSERGVPQSPRGWLITVASRKLVDRWRAETARRRREATVAAMEPPEIRVAPDAAQHTALDDTLPLLFLCCHPALSPPSQVALSAG
jgi:predicted RNA polymerase sigma factor